MTATAPRCSKGWGARCAHAKGPRCTCACGGANHGNPAARRRHDQGELMPSLTKSQTFNPVYLCGACQRPADEHTDADYTARPACASAQVLERDDRRLEHPLHDVIIERTPSGQIDTAGEPITDVTVNVAHRYVVHSPTGFEFGYGGSGPADLALNILGAFVPAVEAWRLHQGFKRHFLVSLDRDRFRHVLPADTIQEWIEQQWREREAA